MEVDKIVTVSVIAYNSSKYILDTLESIKNQTYSNIILIICDDCSTDDTVQVCKEWIDTNSSRFVDTRLIVPPKNTGISDNVNRAWDACKTTYLKLIAGDDILLPNCIEDLMKYVEATPNALVVFGKMDGFGISEENIEEHMKQYFDYSFFSMSPKDQWERLVFRGNCIPAPTALYNIPRLKELGLRNDSRIPLLDDYPLWLNMLKSGVKFHFVDKTLVNYRFSPEAVSTNATLSPRSKKSHGLFFIYYIFPEYWKRDKPRAICRYIKAAHVAWGGWFWNTLYYVLTFFVKS